VEPEQSVKKRRQVLPTALAVAAAAVAIPLWLRRPGTDFPWTTVRAYASLGGLLSAPSAKDDPVLSVALGALIRLQAAAWATGWPAASTAWRLAW
jgi:hypothetical protein